jgi:penicillin-binding protein 2
MRPDRHFDWPQLRAEARTPTAVVDPRRRMPVVLTGFAALIAVVFARAVQLEISEGAAFRLEAARPLARVERLPGVRGRILAADGTVLACDKKVQALAVHYRYLQQPLNPRWLRQTARTRLGSRDRRNPERVAAEQAKVEAERAEVAQRLARLCGLSDREWDARARQIQTRVERIADSVNRRREQSESRDQGSKDRGAARADSRDALKESPAGGFWPQLQDTLRDMLRSSMDQPPPERITVAEELDYHVMAEDVPLRVVAEIEAHPDRYPGTRIIQRQRRAYPANTLAAHVLGHLGSAERDDLQEVGPQGPYHPEDRFGRMGLELQYEKLLHGRRGLRVELTDRSGRVLTAYRQQEPGVGRDLIVTLNPRLQAAAEALLANALERRSVSQRDAEPAGGAIVVLNVQTGALLASAAAPAFDPNLFAADRRAAVTALLADPAHPLFDRVSRMAIPPGSVFKVVTAAALLEAAKLDPQEPFVCRGYWKSPDYWRCAIYQHQGIGHGQIGLVQAIAESCNVYFFQHAVQMGAEPLVDWAARFGFGQATAVDLPQESAGVLPTPRSMTALEGRPWQAADTPSLAIGQSSLLATPLQVVRMMAAVANGGRLVTPHVVSGLGLPELADDQSTADLAALGDNAIHIPPPQPIPGLEAATLSILREGLDQVVSDPNGTGYGTVRLEQVKIAGKTGTAQCGAGRAEHAWFAGYVPADQPRWAFVVVLEHAGNADTAAGPVARRLVLRMQQLGLR